MENVKAKILAVYRGVKKTTPNTTHTKERDALKNDENIIVKRSDKCKSLVIMDKSDCKERAEVIVVSYENVSENSTSKMEEQRKTFMKTILKNKIPDDYLLRLLPHILAQLSFMAYPKLTKQETL